MVEKNISKRIQFKNPKARCAHTATLYNNLLYVFGGGDDKATGFIELYTLDTKLVLIKSLIESSNEINLDTKIEVEIPLVEKIETVHTRNRSNSHKTKYSKEQQLFSEKDAKGFMLN